MTGPHVGPDGNPLAPAPRVRARVRESVPPAAPQAQYDEADIARGQSAAVLGALGRMQLRLDVLAREQSEALGRIEEAMDRLEARLAPPPAPATADQAPASAASPDPNSDQVQD